MLAVRRRASTMICGVARPCETNALLVRRGSQVLLTGRGINFTKSTEILTGNVTVYRDWHRLEELLQSCCDFIATSILINVVKRGKSLGYLPDAWIMFFKNKICRITH